MILDEIYPVGAIYMSTEDKNPGSTLGGTWIRIKDKFLLSAGDTYSVTTQFDANGNPTNGSGGSATHTHSSGTLEAAVFPVVSGSSGYIDVKYKSSTVEEWKETHRIKNLAVENSNESATRYAGVDVIGKTASESNMPPYLTVYMWRRTA
jgi:hypothetical protein